MGFWSSFFGHAAANVYNEMKKEEKETQKWNDLFHEMMECESAFNDYLKSVGIVDSYCADVEYVNSGNIVPIKREISDLRKKVIDYISLGGLGVCVRNLESINDDIEKVKYLKKMGKLDRQVEFAYDDVYTVQSILENEEKNAKQEAEKIKQEEQYCENKLEEQGKKILFNLKSNDLKTVLLEKYEYNNSGDIKIDFVQILTEDIAKQWIKNDDVNSELDLLTVNLVFTKNDISMYDWVTNSQVYYRHHLIKDENIVVEYTPFVDDSVSIVKFGELFLYTSTDNAEIMCKHFRGSKKDNLLCMKDINSLSGVEFENVCQQLVENMGFETETTKASGDGGIDLIAYNHQPLLSGKYIIQCKRYSGSVGEPIIRDLYGVITSERANKGILMTTGYFIKSAISFAEGKPIELIDGEKLGELLQQYNLVVEDVNGSVEETKEPFNPQEFLGYYFYEYEEMLSAVNRDAGDIRSRCLLIEVIHTAIQMRLNLFDLGDNGAYELKTNDIQEMINILGDYLQPLVKNDNSRSSNKKLQYIYYMSLLIDGECSILKGDFANAIEKYSKVLAEWKELNEDNDLFKVDLVYSLFAMFRLLGRNDLIDKYYSLYRNQIEHWKKFYSEHDGDHNKIQLKKLQDKYNVTEYIAFTLYDTSSDEVSVLYDKGIDEWGNIQISFGTAIIDINKGENYFYFASKNIWKKKEQETILVKNIKGVIEKQKAFIK